MLEKATELAKEAVNRWTDNIYSVQSYCSQKFMIPRADFNKQFGIPEEIDYV
jgi:hypothetical protein